VRAKIEKKVLLEELSTRNVVAISHSNAKEGVLLLIVYISIAFSLILIKN